MLPRDLLRSGKGEPRVSNTRSLPSLVGRACLRLALAVLCGMSLPLSLSAQSPTLADFGFDSMTFGGVHARGGLPLLLVVAEFENEPALLHPAHNFDYYQDLVFDGTSSNSLNGYMLENSNGRFWWSNVTTRPIHLANLSSNTTLAAYLQQVGTNDTHLFERLWFSNILHHAMLSNVVDFADFDTNTANGIIEDGELHLFIIANDRGTPGMGRSTMTVQPPRSPVAVHLNAACADEQRSNEVQFATFVHENSHTLGTLDLYGPGCCYNYGVSLMSCTGDPIWHLDPWHKLRLGWVEPRIVALDSPGSVSLPPPQSRSVDAPVILYDPAVGAEEYFILEFRKPGWPSPPNYDRDASTTGLVLWRVWQLTSGQWTHDPVWVTCPCNTNKQCYANFVMGAPDFAFGQGVAWTSDAWTPWLTWNDPDRSANPLPVKLHVLPFTAASTSITVEWILEDRIWVDFAYRGTELGTFGNPYNTLAEAVTDARAGASIHIKAGSSSERPRITKQLNLKSHGGAATIGR